MLEEGDFADLQPIPQHDGPEPVAAIAYDEEYMQAMGYLRALMAKEEYSRRVLQVTADVISMNPAHYTAWTYRANCLFEIHADLKPELGWLEDFAMENLKNFQIWHHRQLILDAYDDASGELEFVSRMLELDSKNYHVWTYRQWVVRRFGLWKGELQYAVDLIRADVFNNSAWSHRVFVVWGRWEGVVAEDSVALREARYAIECLDIEPQNACPWNYLDWMRKQHPSLLSLISETAVKYAKTPDGRVQSLRALEWLASIAPNADQRTAMLDELTQLDPIRKGYYDFQRSRSVLVE